MRPTRRGVAAGALVPLLGVVALILDSPLPLIGIVLVGAWLVGRQAALTDEVVALRRGLTVDQVVDADAVRPGGRTPVRLEVSLDRDASAIVTVEGHLPLVADPMRPLRMAITPGQRRGETVVETHWPLAGEFGFDRPTVTVEDGLFRETFRQGGAPPVVVQAPGLRSFHVGTGGERVRSRYGEHRADRLGIGIEPASIREAVVGDPVSHIDWKATARLGDPHVREYEVETHRETILVLDTRASLGEGEPGAQKHDHLRSVLLAISETAAGLGDPLGVVTVGRAGVTEREVPGTTRASYGTVRRVLAGSGVEGDGPTIRGRGRRQPRDPAIATRHLGALGRDESPFSQTLEPFFAGRGHSGPFQGMGLFGGVTDIAAGGDRRWVVIATDDERPGELRRTVKQLRGKGHAVTCYLAPSVLYRPIEDVEAAYRDYVQFEELRRDLAAAAEVSAYEVGPRDRLARLLEQAEARQRRAAT